MRTFPHPNTSHDWHCFFCKTAADAPVVLIPMPWTENDGIVEAKQVHHECWTLVEAMHEKAREATATPPHRTTDIAS